MASSKLREDKVYRIFCKSVNSRWNINSRIYFEGRKSPKLLKTTTLRVKVTFQISKNQLVAERYHLCISSWRFILCSSCQRLQRGLVFNKPASIMDLSQSLLLYLRRLQLFPGNSFWKSLLLRFQCYKNIPYVFPWLLLNQTKLNKVSLRTVILLFATYISSFICYMHHVCCIFATYSFIYFLHTATSCALENYAFYLLHIFLHLFFLHLFLLWFATYFCS